MNQTQSGTFGIYTVILVAIFRAPACVKPAGQAKSFNKRIFLPAAVTARRYAAYLA
jgi:hypothetical protein